jgi:hypothetical protein
MPKGRQAIYTQVASGSVSNIVFNNIPQNYTDLEILVSSRSQDTGTGSYILSGINGSSSAIYGVTNIYQSIIDYGTSIIGSRGASGTYFGVARLACNSSSGGFGANTFSTIKYYFPEYSGSTYKAISCEVSAPNQTTSSYSTALNAFSWLSNAPMTSINFSAPANYVAGSTFTLYGISR